MRCADGVSNLIAAFIYLCPLGTPPTECGPATAVETHIVNVPPGSCGRDTQELMAYYLMLRNEEGPPNFMLKVVCQTDAK